MELKDALAAPVAPVLPGTKGAAPSSRLEVSGDTAAVELNTEAGAATDGAARDVLVQDGLSPDEWVVTGYRRSEWTMANGELGESARFTFARRGSVAAGVDVDELVNVGARYEPVPRRTEGDHGFLVALGDMQFGKVDGDGVQGAFDRTLEGLNRSVDQLMEWSASRRFGHVHVAWLGDHIEGFVSQGGANTFRTRLTLNEQIRLTRRVMMYAVELFHDKAERVSLVSVPGNHGDPQRFMGKGVTRYDDSHDTEALIAVSEAATLSPAFRHVEFYVPDNDELTVTLDVAGTRVGHSHGHMHRPGKQFEWWEKQAFGGSPLRDADLLLEGHLHHLHVETNGGRMFMGVPALEAESTWYRHSKGVGGRPGVVTAALKDGEVSPIQEVRL